VKRKHICLIITDQQRYGTIAAPGAGHMHTPHLDRLVYEGTSFDNCFITAPELRALARPPAQRLLPARDRHPAQRPGVASHLGLDLGRCGLSLRQRRQDAHHPVRREGRLPPACQARSLLRACPAWRATRDTSSCTPSTARTVNCSTCRPARSRRTTCGPAHRAERERLLHALLEWRVRSSADTMAMMEHGR
jgi:hypothetical protein